MAKQELFQPQERERRLRIIESGVHDLFWKTLKDSMEAYCAVREQEALEFVRDGRHKEAERMAIEVEAIKRIMADPATIIRVNKPLFDKFELKMCQLCGHVMTKVKEIIKGGK